MGVRSKGQEKEMLRRQSDRPERAAVAFVKRAAGSKTPLCVPDPFREQGLSIHFYTGP